MPSGDEARQVVDVYHDLVPALMAVNPRRLHAILPHVLQRRRLDRIVEALVAMWVTRCFANLAAT